MKIDFGSQTPIFLQLSQGLEDEILSGIYREGEQIPSITELAASYKINPATALKGINLLVDAGIVYKKRGIGMFVSQGALQLLKEKDRMNFFSSTFFRWCRRQNASPSSRKRCAIGLKGICRMKLDCIDVSKRFGSVTALDRLNLHLEDQRIHGLLGRNGAGKTTLLRMIGNLIQPSDGQLLWEGKPLWENPQAQQQIFLSTERSWFSELNANEIVRWMKRSYPNFSSEQFLPGQSGLNSTAKLLTSSSPPATVRSCARCWLCRSTRLCCCSTNRPLAWTPSIGSCFTSCSSKATPNRPPASCCPPISSARWKVCWNGSPSSTTESCWSMKRSKRCWNRATVSGRIAEVDDFCADKRVIGSNVVGGLKTSAILGKRQTPPASLDISGLSLQQLFVQLVGSSADEDDPTMK